MVSFRLNAHLHAQPGSRFLIFPIRDGTPLAILLAGDDVMLASSSSDIQRLSKLREHPCISETLLDCRSCPPLHLPPPSRSSARPLPRAPRARPPPVASPRSPCLAPRFARSRPLRHRQVRATPPNPPDTPRSRVRVLLSLLRRAFYASSSSSASNPNLSFLSDPSCDAQGLRAGRLGGFRREPGGPPGG